MRDDPCAHPARGREDTRGNNSQVRLRDGEREGSIESNAEVLLLRSGGLRDGVLPEQDLRSSHRRHWRVPSVWTRRTREPASSRRRRRRCRHGHAPLRAVRHQQLMPCRARAGARPMGIGVRGSGATGPLLVPIDEAEPPGCTHAEKRAESSDDFDAKSVG